MLGVDLEVCSPLDTLAGAGAEPETSEVEGTDAIFWARDFFFVRAWEFLARVSLGTVGSSVCEK